jgi:hypothetical protein
MMMTSMKKSRMIETYRMTQLRQLRGCFLFDMVKIRIGLDSGDSYRDSQSITNVVLASIIGVALIFTNCLCWML